MESSCSLVGVIYGFAFLDVRNVATDILTPLAALGVDFQIDPGTGPKIRNPIRSSQDIENIGQLHDVNQQLPFISTILQVLFMVQMDLN